MRVILAAAVAAGLAAPISAEPLPQGDFMLGSYVWGNDQVPRYVTLRVAGEAVEIRFSWPTPLDPDACVTEGICDTDVPAATATGRLREGRVALDEVSVDADAPIMMRDLGPPHLAYTVPVLGRVDNAVLTRTDAGFDLTQGGDTLSFFAVTPAVREIISIYAEALELSISRLRGCEVRQLAALFADPAPSSGEVAFRDALAGVRLQWQVSLEQRALRRVPNESLTDAQRANMAGLQMQAILPGNLAMAEPGPTETAAEVVWDQLGSQILQGDREAYDAMLVSYGDTLEPLVGFYRHLASIERAYDPEVVCTDLSQGFIADRD